MSKSKTKRCMKWHLITPCLAAFLTFLLMYEQSSDPEDYGAHRGADQSIAFSMRLRQAFDASVGDLQQASNSEPDCDDECQRGIKDLGAQLDMAFWAQAMFWTNVLIFIVTGFGVYYVARTLGATITAAKPLWKVPKQLSPPMKFSVR